MPTSVSVIIPTYDRPERLNTCLQSISDLHYPEGKLEIIVVDDGSPVPVSLPDRAGANVTLLRQANAGPAAARNAGVVRATGRYLAFLDDDCRPEPNWLCRLVDRLEQGRGEPSMAGGHTVNVLTENPYSEASQALLSYVYRRLNRVPDDARFLTTNNMVVDRAGFEAIGGFDPRFRTAEDRDLCLRWRASGRRIAYDAEATMRHAHDLTLLGFWDQHYAYGHGAYRLQKKHADTSRSTPTPSRSWNEAVRYYLGMLVCPFRTHSPSAAARLSALVTLSQVASTAGLIDAAVREGR